MTGWLDGSVGRLTAPVSQRSGVRIPFRSEFFLNLTCVWFPDWIATTLVILARFGGKNKLCANETTFSLTGKHVITITKKEKCS